MKYYKNLIERKKYSVIIISICTVLVGIFVCYLSVKDVFDRGLALSKTWYLNDGYGIISVIASSNVGMILCGLLIIYIGICYLPVTSPFSQDEIDYDVKNDGDNIYVRFQSYEFLVKREDFGPTKLFFRDKNKKFVTVTRGYQIYNYVVYYFKNILEKNVNSDSAILKSEVVDKFKNVKVMTKEDKISFIESERLRNKIKIGYVLLSIILWFGFVFWIYIFIIMLKGDINVMTVILVLILIWISFILGKKTGRKAVRDKNLVNRILNNEMFMVSASIFDKKNERVDDGDFGSVQNYYIKVTDGMFVVNHWIKVPKEVYNKDRVTIYIFDKYASDYFLIK